jgi:hypothetical protein
VMNHATHAVRRIDLTKDWRPSAVDMATLPAEARSFVLEKTYNVE